MAIKKKTAKKTTTRRKPRIHTSPLPAEIVLAAAEEEKVEHVPTKRLHVVHLYNCKTVVVEDCHSVDVSADGKRVSIVSERVN